MVTRIFCPRSFKFYTMVYVIVMYDYTCDLLCHYDPYSQFISHITLSHQSLLHLQIVNKLVSLCTSYYVVKVWGLPMSSAPMDLYNDLPLWVSYTAVYALNFCEDKFLQNFTVAHDFVITVVSWVNPIRIHWIIVGYFILLFSNVIKLRNCWAK